MISYPIPVPSDSIPENVRSPLLAFSLVLFVVGSCMTVFSYLRYRKARQRLREMKVRHAKERELLVHKAALCKFMLAQGYSMPWLVRDERLDEAPDAK